MKKKVIYIIIFISLFMVSISSIKALNLDSGLILAKIVTVDCGNVTNIPKKIPDLTSLVFTLIEIAVPILLVIFGSLDLIKGVTAGKEDEIKKGQQMLIKRLIAGALVFVIFMVVKFLVSVVDNEESSNNAISCMNCFINGSCN